MAIPMRLRTKTSELNETRFAQPALFTIEYAMSRLWQSFGVRPDAIIGHSMGEYVAACLAGVFSLEDALHLIATRALLVSELPQGAMLAVLLPEAELLPLLSEKLSISLINGPNLCVVAGPVSEMAEFETNLNTKGILSRRIQNGHAFHSPMLDPIVQSFEHEVRKIRLNKPTIPYISNVTGRWITSSEATNPAYWAMHATHKARFNDALYHLWQFKNPILLEAGPGRTLITLALQYPGKDIDARPVTVSSVRHNYENRSDVEFLLDNLGILWTSNADIKWENVYPGQRGRRIALPTYPFQRKNYWLQPVPPSDAPSKRSEAIQKNPDPSEWLYLQSWKRLLPKRVEVSDLPSHPGSGWLFFVDDGGLCSTLTNTLASAGHSVVTVKAGNSFRQLDHDFTIDPANSQHFDRLVQDLKSAGTVPTQIVHAWSFNEKCCVESDSDNFKQAQTLGFHSLMFLARALAANDVGMQSKLFVLSNDTQDVIGTEELSPNRATLLGPCIVIRQEYPNILTKHIDLDISAGEGEHESTAQLLLGEFLDIAPNLFVAYRNGQRWVQTYEPLNVDNDLTQRSTLRQGGVYLITGGLGTVGRRSLISGDEIMQGSLSSGVWRGRENWNASLASSDPNDARINARIRALERIETLGGEVLYLSANVADPIAMQTVLQQTYKRFGALHGVLHGAGIVGDYLEIKDSSVETCEPHFKAKAAGLNVLEYVLEGQPLDFCLLLSSLACVLGGLGQAAYASANIYMDAFTRKHNRSSSVPWISVNWDVWRSGVGTKDSTLGSTLKDLGMTPSEASQVMETVLRMKHVDHLIVSTGDLGARIDQWIKLESLGKGPVAKSAKESTISEDKTEQRIARIWQDALGIDDLGINDSFAQLGGHSLLAIRIVSEMRQAFQIDVPVRALFDSPTIAQLASYIKKCIIAKIEALTEEEAQALLRMNEASESEGQLVANRVVASTL
jgi:acyl transferase domain-containing protein